MPSMTSKDEKIRAVAYIRVSKEDLTPENQLASIERFAEREGYEVVRVFVDEISGAVPPRKRLEYLKMLKYCNEHGIRTIIMYDLSRLSRDMYAGISELLKLTEEFRVVLFSEYSFLNDIKDPLQKKKVIADFLWFAELYREDIRRRTKAALELRTQMGVQLGNPKLKNRVTEKRKEKVIKLRKEGFTIREISKEVGLGVGTVHKIIKEAGL